MNHLQSEYDGHTMGQIMTAVFHIKNCCCLSFKASDFDLADLNFKGSDQICAKGLRDLLEEAFSHDQVSIEHRSFHSTCLGIARIYCYKTFLHGVLLKFASSCYKLTATPVAIVF